MIKRKAVVKESGEQDGWMIVMFWKEQELRDTRLYTDKEYVRMGEEIAVWCKIQD